MKQSGLMILFALFSLNLYAQVSNALNGRITGEVRDENKNPIEDVNILIFKDSIAIASFCCTDLDGRYKMNHAPSGIYDIKFEQRSDRINCPSGYLSKTIKRFTIYSNRYSVLNVTLTEDTTVTRAPIQIMPFNHFYYYKRE